jgi:predicted MFS family arabinose efflux permease
MAVSHSWNTVMYAAALMALASFLLVSLTYRDPPGRPAGSSSGLNLKLTRNEWLSVSIAGSIWTTYNAGLIVLISFLPELFRSHGYSITGAGSVVSFLGWMLIATIPLAGYFAERLRQQNSFLTGGFLIAGLAAAVLPFMDEPIIAFSVLAAVVGAPAGLIMALPAQALRPQNRASGMGIYFTWYYAGMALLPGLAGMARDLAGSPTAPTLFAAGMMALALAGFVGFRLAKN